LAQVKRLGVEIERVIRNKHKFLEAEVTDVVIKKTNIDKILNEVMECEKTLQAELSFDNVQRLMEKYQMVFS